MSERVEYGGAAASRSRSDIAGALEIMASHDRSDTVCVDEGVSGTAGRCDTDRTPDQELRIRRGPAAHRRRVRKLAKDKEVELASIARDEELSIADRREEFTTRTQLLDRAIDAARSLQDRQQVLRFLVAVGSDENMKTW